MKSIALCKLDERRSCHNYYQVVILDAYTFMMMCMKCMFFFSFIVGSTLLETGELSEVRISEFKISVCFIVQVCNVRYVHLARLVL